MAADENAANRVISDSATANEAFPNFFLIVLLRLMVEKAITYMKQRID